MNHPIDLGAWWTLHLRKARGESLSVEEQQLYDAELARQDREAPLKSDLGTLRRMRDQARALARDNVELRGRLNELEKEIQIVEESLSRETREALGVGK